MNFTSNSVPESPAILVDSYTKDGLMIRTYSHDIDKKNQEKRDILLRERIKKVINETEI